MKQKNYLKVFTAFIALMLMSVFANTAFGIGILPTASALVAGSLLLSFVPSTNVCLQTIVPSIFEMKTYGYGIKRAPKYVSKRFPGASRFGSAAYLTDAEIAAEKEKKDKEGQVEVKTAADVLKFLNETKSALEETLKTEVKAEVKESTEAKLAEIEKKVGEVKGLPEGVTADELKQLIEDFKITTKVVDRMQISFKNGRSSTPAKPEIKSFNQILAETIERNADEIKGYKPMVGKTGEQVTSFKMFSDDERKSIDISKEGEVKAVGDMTMAVNFPGAATMYQDVRSLVQNPYNKVYLADILPNGTSGGSQIAYPKESIGNENVSSWTDYTANKQQVDFKIDPKTVPFIWGAGYVIIQRDMLDDIPFMTSYLQSRLLISLKNWENTLITGGAAGIDGLQTVGTNYSGALTNPVDRLIDAAYGQIVDDTKEFYNGTHAIVRSRDLITKIALNKSTGSGKYDLPSGAVVFNPDGTVKIGNLTVVGTTSIPTDTFYALDSRATLFVRRIMPELRLFEDATLAKKNQVMWRIEERATFMVFNDNAIVKGVLQTS